MKIRNHTKLIHNLTRARRGDNLDILLQSQTQIVYQCVITMNEKALIQKFVL